MLNATEIIANYQTVLAEIRQQKALSPWQQKVRLVVVSKTWPIEVITALLPTGQRDFGENKVQELTAKAEYCKQRYPDKKITWHLLGKLQSNKVSKAVRYADVIHSIDSISLAEKIDSKAAHINKKITGFLQLNLADESQKSGASIAHLVELLNAVQDLRHLKVVGLMCLPPQYTEKEASYWFQLLRTIAQQQQEMFPFLQQLSMGMSQDYAAAIMAGSNLVRVGSAIFGARTQQ